MKRTLDIFLAIIVLILCVPLIVIVFVLIRFKLGSPVFFVQERPGLHGSIFKLIKFRTMLDTTECNGEPVSDDMRLTKFSQTLRSTSLDELPTLINVLLGDISLVGPRPLLPEYLSLYNKTQYRRHEVRPGVTGWAQVNGRNAITWEMKFEYDVWYVDNQSFGLDCKILLKTVIKVFLRDGITRDNHVTTSKFQGTQKENPAS